MPTLRAAARPYICVIPPNLPAFPHYFRMRWKDEMPTSAKRQ